MKFYDSDVTIYSYVDVINGNHINTYGWTAIICQKVALVVLQSDITFEGVKGRYHGKKDVFDLKDNQLQNVLNMRKKLAKL